MKNWSVIVLALVVCVLSSIDLQAQDSRKVVYSDTLNVSFSEHAISHDQIFVGKVDAYDPENQNIEYFMIYQNDKPIFTIDKYYGHIYTRREFMPYLCEHGSFDLTVWVTDGELASSANILVNIICH